MPEVARQGYPTFFASTPVALKYTITVLTISALLVRDAFNFLLDLPSYHISTLWASPDWEAFIKNFNAATAIALWLLSRRPNEGAANVFLPSVGCLITWWFLQSVFLLDMPWFMHRVSMNGY